MGSKIEFTKMVASGNDFVIVEFENQKSKIKNFGSLAKEICSRKYGIGADGLLVIEKSRVADFKMHVFNPDGSEAEMCGNGLRCVALFEKSKIKNQKSKILKIETKAGILEAIVNKDAVKVKMAEPKDLRMNINLNVGGEKYLVHFINTGVPHTVLFVKEIKNVDVNGLGRIIRFHHEFLPRGTNVDFVEVRDKGNIFLRTYERGVEEETLACGTGAVAASIISNVKKQISAVGKFFKINVHTESGEILRVHFEREKDKFKNVWLEGKARIVFKGVYYYGKE
ncbi:MAG: diaminopimelate epimerase [Candidatus Omnitrophica bacterium]|nr:diaminopimelate epimerase [Candidatus Omnitrophota bacterium]MCM8793812.1 diaminopimelate epimerase [Candidatus Omnitrophota bacterium]